MQNSNDGLLRKRGRRRDPLRTTLRRLLLNFGARRLPLAVGQKREKESEKARVQVKAGAYRDPIVVRQSWSNRCEPESCVCRRARTRRTRAGSPARDQSRIWQVTGMVTHGRGIGPFETCTESMVPGREAQSEANRVGSTAVSYWSWLTSATNLSKSSASTPLATAAVAGVERDF